MALDWHMLKRCIGQCLLLAGPGVMMGTVMMAFFIMYGLPYHFSWSLALAFGAVDGAAPPSALGELQTALANAREERRAVEARLEQLLL